MTPSQKKPNFKKPSLIRVNNLKETPLKISRKRHISKKAAYSQMQSTSYFSVQSISNKKLRFGLIIQIFQIAWLFKVKYIYSAATQFLLLKHPYFLLKVA